MQKENGKDTEIQAHHGASIDYHKKELECQKLRAEIAQISLAWWKKPAYVSIVIPIVIALIALLTAWSKGYFSSERATLKKEILDMTIQITEEKAHLQEIIDDAYMIISIAEFTARFALKDHVRPMLDNINRNLKQLQQKKAINDDQLSSEIESVAEMVKTAEEQLDEVKKSLTKLKASNWVIRLKPLPVGLNLPGQRLLCDPEKHKVYDIAKKDFIDVKEFLDSQPDFKRVWQNFCE